MQKVLKDYQTSKVSYDRGDLNRDNKITNADLTILRKYIDDTEEYTKVQKYLDNPEKYPLTEEEILKIDRDKDKTITPVDLSMIEAELNNKGYNAILRHKADVNEDGYIDEADYIMLKNEIDNGLGNLKIYDIPFALGWLDVQTEALLEADMNEYGLISEVSK